MVHFSSSVVSLNDVITEQFEHFNFLGTTIFLFMKYSLIKSYIRVCLNKDNSLTYFVWV